jgi:hypothetical protein
MKYERLPQFQRDWLALPQRERELVKRWLREILGPAVEQFQADPEGYAWPKKLRFESINGAPGVFAVTWSFAGPDGRATFHFRREGGEPILVWRRIGHHEICDQP